MRRFFYALSTRISKKDAPTKESQGILNVFTTDNPYCESVSNNHYEGTKSDTKKQELSHFFFNLGEFSNN